MVSKSRKLYQNIVGFVRAHYVEKGDPAVCTLRSQLLMALHDSGTASELCQVRVSTRPSLASLQTLCQEWRADVWMLRGIRQESCASSATSRKRAHWRCWGFATQTAAFSREW
jgi:hypothetical protein